MKTQFPRLLLLAAGLALGTSLRAEPVLVGHAKLSGQALDDEAIKAVLLGKRTMLGDVRVVIIIAKASDPQEEFLKAHIAMTTSQFQNYWRRLFMTGGGTAPKVVETEDDACKFASETSGGVAIVDSSKAGALPALAAK